MTHDEIQTALFSLVDGPLTEKERKLVESHLPACASCRQALAQWRQISPVLFPKASFPEIQEDRMVAAVLERIRARPSAPRFLSLENSLRWIFPLVGSALAAAWVFFYIVPTTPELSSLPAAETDYYSSSTPEAVSNQWNAMPAAYHDDMVVSMIKE
jgi:anti-sigma factor RsiW